MKRMMTRMLFHTQYLWYGTILSRGTQASLPPCVHVSLSMPSKEDNADKQIITLVCVGFTVFTAQMALAEVDSWCTAYKQGARSGCKITHVNGTRVRNWDEYTRLALGKQTFSMTLLYKSSDSHRQAVVRRKRMCFAYNRKRVHFLCVRLRGADRSRGKDREFLVTQSMKDIFDPGKIIGHYIHAIRHP